VLVVDRVALRERRDAASLDARVRARGREPVQLRIEVPAAQADALRPSGSPWLVATLLPAMMSGRTLVVDAPVSPALARGVERAQEVLIGWWGERYRLAPVRVRAPAAAPAAGGRARAAYFSRGIDSYFTVLERGAGLTHLLYSATVDFQHDDGRRQRALGAARRAAADLGLPLIPVHTNLRAFHDDYAGWVHGYGQALAAIGHALGGLLGEVRISTAYRVDQGIPWASHPMLAGPLSSESTTIQHVGGDARRIDKVAALAGRDAVVRRLYVCVIDDSDGNCGRCEKCLRTMVELEAAGADSAAIFEAPLTPEALAAVRMRPTEAVWWHEVLDHPGLARLGPRYRQAIEAALAASGRQPT
jgi:hypothetical protein